MSKKKVYRILFFHWHQAGLYCCTYNWLGIEKNLNLPSITALNRQEEIWVQALKFSVYQGNGINTVFIFKTQIHLSPYLAESIPTVLVTMTIQVSSTPDSTCYYRTTVPSWHNVLLSPLFLGVPKEGPRCVTISPFFPGTSCHLCLHIRALEVPSPGLWWWREMLLLLCHETPAQMSLKTVTLCSPTFCWF